MTIQWRFVCLLNSLIAIYACGCAKENPRVLTTVDLGASLTGPLPWDPMQGKVITTWMDSGSETMSTLYGNDVAIDHARKSTEQCAAGAIVSLVTWTQREDPRWFGAKIPGKVQSVAFILVRRASNQEIDYSYRRFGGQPLRQSRIEDGQATGKRVEYLLSQLPSVMP
jgi:hypothetical protein